MALFLFWFGFLLGALTIVAVEVWILIAVIDRLLRRRTGDSDPSYSKGSRDFVGQQSIVSAINKQGSVWMLEPEKVPKIATYESPTKGSKELKNNKSIVEVYPIRKYAKIKDHSLILAGPDGSQTTIELVNCTIVAVSASDLSTRKWAKKYPIRLESQNSVLYKGSKTCYLYCETAWEKESWCKALRLASCLDREKLNWFAQLRNEFRHYLISLSTENSSFSKPPALLGEAPYKANRNDVSSSKVRLFLKKIAKKASKNGVESKTTSISSSFPAEGRTGDKISTPHDVSSIDESVKSSSERTPNNPIEDLVQGTTPTSSKSLPQLVPDSVCNEKIATDEGTLCWNLLFSRLFFDAKRSNVLNDAIKARIQRTLSNMRTPGYIGGVTCTGLNLGDLPPFIHKMRVLPMDLNEVWAVEVDIEYSGGIVLDVETRIEVCDKEKDNTDGTSGSSSAGEATLDLLEGADYHGSPSRFSSNTGDLVGSRDEVDKIDGLKQSKKGSSNYASRWKAAVHSIANKVSQVPISLAIRIASLRGTLRLHIKPPPSDQLWFGFTTMPDIEWNLDSAVGDQKITSNQVAMIIGNRFKASIRELLVLPNCENICIPWMLAEKDDWVPRSVAPFLWINQEAMNMTGLDPTSTSSQAGEDNKQMPDSSTRGKTMASSQSWKGDKQKHSSSMSAKTNVICCPEHKVEEIKGTVHIQQPSEDSHIKVTTDFQSRSIGSVPSSGSFDSNKMEELKEPLLRTDVAPESYSQEPAELESPPKISSSSGEYSVLDHEKFDAGVDKKPKKLGSRKTRMLDLGKKMGEKLEEKRRQIEERSRHVVGKMRENART